MREASRRELYALGECLGECVSREEFGRRVMGSGGGGGGGTSTTVQSIPDELKPLASAYTNKAIGLSNQGFRPYGGQRFADLNGTQRLGLGMTMDRALSGSPVMNQANTTLMQTMQGGQNPYLDSMVNKAQTSVLGAGQQAGVRSGSFGNSGIAEMTARQMGDIATSMYGGAYEADRGRQMQALSMAPTFANQAYTDASQLLKAGQVYQDQAQQGLDFNYQTFQEAQNKPYKDLSAMAGVFGSNLGGSSTTTQTGGGK